jgi:hypothetical protein
MNSQNERLIDFGEDNLTGSGLEEAPEQLSEVISAPPPHKTRDVRIQTEFTQGEMNAALSKGGDNYDIRLDRRVDIMLEENDKIPPTGQPIGVNGFLCLLRPGERASVPMGLLDVLNNAVEDVPVMDGDQITSYRQKLRFPYRIIVKR